MRVYVKVPRKSKLKIQSFLAFSINMLSFYLFLCKIHIHIHKYKPLSVLEKKVKCVYVISKSFQGYFFTCYVVMYM